MNILKTWVLVAFTFAFTVSLRAQPKISQPGYYRVLFGKYQIIALSDGTVPIDAHKLLIPKDTAVLDEALQENNLSSPVEISINTYLIVSGQKIILVDTGAGSLFSPNAGLLPASLKAAGYSASQITDILVTHIHRDHTGGLTVKGKVMFPHAIIHVNQKDLDFWLKHEVASSDDTRGITSNRPSYLAVKPYLAAGKVKPFEGDMEVLPGIRTIEKPGHTAGHTLFVLSTGNQKMVFWGDLAHIEQVQFADPLMPNEFDFDQAQAAQQRKESYAEFAKQGYLIAGDHISFPGLGRITGSSQGYRWEPLPYSILGRVN